jgi:hypothetical protein
MRRRKVCLRSCKEERLKFVKGTFSIHSQPKRGTRIQFTPFGNGASMNRNRPVCLREKSDFGCRCGREGEGL